jgi:hypothetical protein
MLRIEGDCRFNAHAKHEYIYAFLRSLLQIEYLLNSSLIQRFPSNI